MKKKRNPYLVLWIPEQFKGRRIFIEYDVNRELERDMEYELIYVHRIPDEVRKFITSDLVVEFNQMVANEGLDLRYEFTHYEHGKIFKQLHLLKNNESVVGSGVFCDHAETLFADVIGNFGLYQIKQKIRYKVSANEEMDNVYDLNRVIAYNR